MLQKLSTQEEGTMPIFPSIKTRERNRIRLPSLESRESLISRPTPEFGQQQAPYPTKGINGHEEKFSVFKSPKHFIQATSPKQESYVKKSLKKKPSIPHNSPTFSKSSFFKIHAAKKQREESLKQAITPALNTSVDPSRRLDKSCPVRRQLSHSQSEQGQMSLLRGTTPVSHFIVKKSSNQACRKPSVESWTSEILNSPDLSNRDSPNQLSAPTQTRRIIQRTRQINPVLANYIRNQSFSGQGVSLKVGIVSMGQKTD